jgi:hypothetical protein
VEYITKTLIERRNRVGKAFYAKVLPLDRFETAGGRLKFTDLAVEAGFAPPRRYEIEWFRYDNAAGTQSALPSKGEAIPEEAQRAAGEAYFGAKIRSDAMPGKTVTVYLRTRAGAPAVVGIERSW